MWRRFYKENSRYIGALCIMLGIMALFLYGYLGWREISGVYAQNASRADSVATAIAILPRVSSIPPAKTSGPLAYVLTTRSELLKSLEHDYAPKNAHWIYTLNPAYYALDARKSQHEYIHDDIASRLQETTAQLTQLKKLIEYAPLVDLATPFANDDDIAERLNRTKVGINDAIAYIQSSKLPRKAQISSELFALNTQTLALTDETKAQWADTLYAIQTLIIEDIERLDIKNSQYYQQLEHARSLYQ